MTIMPTNPWPESDPDYEYVPDAMGRLGRGTWRRRRRHDPFGRIEINPDFEQFLGDFDLEKPLKNIFHGRPFDLVAPVGREGGNEQFDVAKIETLLAKAGFLDLKPTDGPTGYYGFRLEDAIRRFQDTENLKVDGLVNPTGPTLAALAKRATETEGADETPTERADPTDESKSANLLEAAMRRRYPMIPPLPGGIFKRGPTDGRGGLRDRKPIPPPPILPDAGPDAPKTPGQEFPNPEDALSRREAAADEFIKEIMKPLESHRGDDTTRKGNDIVARECREVLREKYPDLEENIKHVGGATEDGSGQEKDELSEKYVPNKKRKDLNQDARPGSNHPDLTWWDRRKEKEDPKAHAHANTATMKKKKSDGENNEPTARERDSYQRLVENVGESLANLLPKLRPGTNEEEYRMDVRRKCEEIFDKWFSASRKGRNGENDSSSGLDAP